MTLFETETHFFSINRDRCEPLGSGGEPDPAAIFASLLSLPQRYEAMMLQCQQTCISQRPMQRSETEHLRCASCVRISTCVRDIVDKYQCTCVITALQDGLQSRGSRAALFACLDAGRKVLQCG
jgi:hypothetical protein